MGSSAVGHAPVRASPAPSRARLVKAPPGGGKSKKKTESVQCTPPPPLLFCLLYVTNLECPAGTNYSILMSAVSNNCIWRACYPLIHMLTATTSSQITFLSDEDACLVLASWPGISPQSHQGQEAVGRRQECSCLQNAKDCGPSWQGHKPVRLGASITYGSPA